MLKRLFAAALAAALLLPAFPSLSLADEMKLADGKITMTAPDAWKKKTPAVRIIEFEYEIPAVEGDDRAGRLTVMSAGGSVEANIDRWVGQFKQTKEEQEKTKKEETKVNGQTVHMVDISGTYKDSPGGPFAGGKTIERENYRMLGAIIPTKEAGTVFLKFYGPKATVDKNADNFKKMVGEMKVK